jgi:hypothetical protein
MCCGCHADEVGALKERSLDNSSQKIDIRAPSANGASLIAMSQETFLSAWALFRSTSCRRD